MRKDGWQEEDLVSWLERGDICLITCHPHQGVPNDWIPEKLYALLVEKLYNRSREYLNCPIFRQDKICYIHGAYKCFIPTLRITLFTIDDIDDVTGKTSLDEYYQFDQHLPHLTFI